MIKIFNNKDVVRLENEVNTWITKNNVELVNANMAVGGDSIYCIIHYCKVSYA